MLHPTAVPRRDIVACAIGLLGTLAGFAFERVPPPRPTPKAKRRLDVLFLMMSFMELISTVVLPWAMIINEKRLGGGKIDDKSSAIYLMASHLFIFQAQIALESLVAMAPERQRSMMFPLTCVANAFRVVPLLTWLSRSGHGFGYPTWRRFEDWNGLAGILPVVGFLLWMFSSFYFIPFEWYPILQRAQVGARKKD